MNTLQILNRSLREEFLREVNYNVLMKMRIFSGTNQFAFSEQFMQALSLCVTESTYMPDENIIESEELEWSMYYLSKGIVELIVDLPENRRTIPAVIAVIKVRTIKDALS